MNLVNIVNPSTISSSSGALMVLDGNAVVPMNDKGKTGSIARAIAFASRDVRIAMGQSIIVKQLSNGMYRPFARDVVETLVPKSARPFVTVDVNGTGPMSKDEFTRLCVCVSGALAIPKKDGTVKELKGEKLFMATLVDQIARNVPQGDAQRTVDAEVH